MWFTQKCNKTYEFAVVVLSLVVSLDAPLFFDRPIPVKEFILMICGQNHHLVKKNCWKQEKLISRLRYQEKLNEIGLDLWHDK